MLLKRNKINGKDNTNSSMFLIKNETSNKCTKMLLCQSSSFNTMIQVTLKTEAVYSSETSVSIHDTQGRRNTERIVFVLCIYYIGTYCF